MSNSMNILCTRVDSIGRKNVKKNNELYETVTCVHCKRYKDIKNLLTYICTYYYIVDLHKVDGEPTV